jgi:hypothetical protein
MDIAEVAISVRRWDFNIREFDRIGPGRRRPHRLPLNAAITMLVWTHLSLTLLIIATVLVSGWVWANIPHEIV